MPTISTAPKGKLYFARFCSKPSCFVHSLSHLHLSPSSTINHLIMVSVVFLSNFGVSRLFRHSCLSCSGTFLSLIHKFIFQVTYFVCCHSRVYTYIRLSHFHSTLPFCPFTLSFMFPTCFKSWIASVSPHPIHSSFAHGLVQYDMIPFTLPPRLTFA